MKYGKTEVRLCRNATTLGKDSASAVARRAAAILDAQNLRNPGENPGHSFHVTDMPHRFMALGQSFLGRPMDDVRLETLDNC